MTTDRIDAEAQLQSVETPAQRETLGLFWRAAHMIKADLTDAALHTVLTFIFNTDDYDQYNGRDIPKDIGVGVLKRTGHFLFAGAYSTAIALRAKDENDHPLRKPENKIEVRTGLLDENFRPIDPSQLDDHMQRHLAEHLTAVVIVQSALQWEWSEAFSTLAEHAKSFGLHSAISITGDMLRLFMEADGLKVIGGEPLDDSPDG